MTTAGMGVITWRASCSCRWKTPVSIPASPGSSTPPARAWEISSLSSSGVVSSAPIVSGSTPSSRRIRLAIAVSTTENGLKRTRQSSSGRATRRATPSAWPIA